MVTIWGAEVNQLLAVKLAKMPFQIKNLPERRGFELRIYALALSKKPFFKQLLA